MNNNRFMAIKSSTHTNWQPKLRIGLTVCTPLLAVTSAVHSYYGAVLITSLTSTRVCLLAKSLKK